MKIYEGVEKQTYGISSYPLPVIPLLFPDISPVESQLSCVADSVWEMGKPQCALTYFPVSLGCMYEDATI